MAGYLMLAIVALLVAVGIVFYIPGGATGDGGAAQQKMPDNPDTGSP